MNSKYAKNKQKEIRAEHTASSTYAKLSRHVSKGSIWNELEINDKVIQLLPTGETLYSTLRTKRSVVSLSCMYCKAQSTG